MAAAFERASIPERDRKPTFLFIDEAAPYFDDAFEKLLTRLRQFRVGAVIAFQHLEQTSPKLRSAIAASTSIKYAGRLGHTDRNWMAREMETTPEFIQSQQKDTADPPRWTQFACFALGSTRSAVSLTVPFGTLENEARMTDEQHRDLITHNKARVSSSPTTPKAPEPIVNFTPRPPEMEPWRLDSADKPKNDDDPPPKPTTPKKVRRW
jgi:hypothetical protein